MTMTYSFTDIVAGQTDADSIINQVLMDALRENIYHLQEFCYGVTDPFTPDAKHNHDDVNSKAVGAIADNAVTQAAIAANAVGQGELKVGTGSGSTGPINAGAYGEVATSQYALGVNGYFGSSIPVHRSPSPHSSYVEYAGYWNSDTVSRNITVYFSYVTASIPRVVIYYNPETGEIDGGVWESDQPDLPETIWGEPLECIYLYDAKGNPIPKGKLICEGDHPLALDRAKNIEELKQAKVCYSRAIFDDYRVNLSQKPAVELKPNPQWFKTALVSRARVANVKRKKNGSL